MDRMLSLAEIAEILDIHERSVHRFIRRGQLTAEQHPLTKRWRVSEVSAKKLLLEARQKQEAQWGRDGEG
jgi:predicted site-specific integrase-resolvase